MNYIHKLQKSVAGLESEVRAYQNVIADLRIYLLSDKFYKDPTVQVRDVLHRIEEGIRMEIDRMDDDKGESE